MANKNKEGCCSNWTGKEWGRLIIAEVALFAFFYYLQYLLNVGGNLWLSSLILLVLINISVVVCPVTGSCCK